MTQGGPLSAGKIALFFSFSPLENCRNLGLLFPLKFFFHFY